MSRIFEPILQLLRSPTTNARAPRGGVAFDGTVASRVVSTLTNQPVGTDPFSLVVGVKVAATQQNSTVVKLSSSTSAATANTFAIEKQFGTPANLAVVLYGNTPADFRYYRYVNFFTSRAGKDVQLAVSRSSAGVVTLWADGVPLTPDAEITAGTPPAWTASVTATFMVVGLTTDAAPSIDTIRSATLYNLALTQSDVTEIYELGGAVPERFKFGSQTELYGNPGFETAGAGGADVFASWAESTSGASAITRDTTDFQSGTASCKIFIDGSNSALEIGQSVVVAGKPHRLRFWAKADAAASDLIKVDAGAAALILGSQIPLTTSWQPFVFEFTAVDSTVKFRRANANNRTIWIDTTSLVRLGAVVHLPLNDGAGYQLRDDSTNRLHALMTTTGVSHVLPKPGGAFPLRFTTNTSGNQQALGASCVTTDTQVLRVRARTRSGTSTVSLGNVSGGAQIVSGAALTTSWQVLTIVGGSHITSTQNLWVNSNNNNVIEWDIELESLSI